MRDNLEWVERKLTGLLGQDVREAPWAPEVRETWKRLVLLFEQMFGEKN